MSDTHTPATGIPDALTGDLTVRELVEVVEHLQFRRPGRIAVVELDSHVARFFIDLLKPGSAPRHSVRRASGNLNRFLGAFEF
jgi:hypothetical protein